MGTRSSRAEPEAVRLAVDLDAAAVGDHVGAVLLGDVDVAGDLVAVLLGDERPHVGAAAAIADAQCRDPLLDLLDQRVRDRVDREHDRDGHAALARRAEPGVDRGVRDQVEVSIRQHEHVVLRAAEQPVDGDLVAVQHVEHAVGQPRLLEQPPVPSRKMPSGSSPEWSTIVCTRYVDFSISSTSVRRS